MYRTYVQKCGYVDVLVVLYRMSYLKINFEENKPQESESITDIYACRNKPFADSIVYEAAIESSKLLTEAEHEKRVYELGLQLKDNDLTFLPGDCIGILPENDQEEVELLLLRLNVEKVSHKLFSFGILENTTKRNASIPKHLPPTTTIYDVFLKHINIRLFPKKIFLKNLLKYTRDPTEKQLLEHLCSPAGSKDYSAFTESNCSLLSILNTFPSCQPTVEFILENSTPLNARFFSIASSPTSSTVTIIFHVIEKSGRRGVCTGWLEKYKGTVPIYLRQPGQFRFDNYDIPTVLIATGTGIAPFMAFLRHKEVLCNLVETLLFYGCRNEGDFLCKEELESLNQKKILTKLSLAFSRAGGEKEYVQKRILEQSQEIVKMILEKRGRIYVCGNAKTMVKDVKSTLSNMFSTNVFTDLEHKGRFLVDTWI